MGLKAAIGRVFDASWQRGRGHWMRNALAHVPKGQHTVVAAASRPAFTQPDQKGAIEIWRHVADQLRARWPKLAGPMDRAMGTPLVRVTMARSEDDMLACMAFRPSTEPSTERSRTRPIHWNA